MVVCRVASDTDEADGLLPHNLGIDSHDHLLSYHYLGESLISHFSSV